MSVLKKFPRLNNLWMEAKHRVSHRIERRQNSFDRDFSVSEPRPVVLVVIDSLRADHVGSFGYEKPTTPTLDSFDAAAFPRAIAPAPWTFPSVSSILSGRYPHNHGARFDSDPRDLSSQEFPTKPAADVPMLPDLLSAAGYKTAMVTAIPMAERAVGDRFETVRVQYSDAKERIDTALRWLSSVERPFLHLHLGDPHAPLDIPDRHRATFDVPSIDDLEGWKYRETTDREGFEAYRDARIRAYDAALRGADDALQRLFDSLPDDAVIVVCSDHGEALWDHPELERELNEDPRGYYGTDHGHSVLPEVADVPLWVRAPNVESQDRRVSLVDVFPTVLTALGVNKLGDIDGVPLQRDGEWPAAVLCEETAYGYNQRAAWVGEQQGVVVPETGVERQFDLFEETGAHPAGAELTDQLREAFCDFDFDGDVGGDEMEVDHETKDLLEELGYLE